MKKLSSIELLHANGDSTVILKESILDVIIEDITENWELEDDYSFEKIYSCSGFHLEILYNEEDSDKDVVEGLLSQRDLAGFVLYYKKEKNYKTFELPYIGESEEDLNNIFEVAINLDIKDIIENAEEGMRAIVLDVSMENLEFEDEGVD